MFLSLPSPLSKNKILKKKKQKKKQGTQSIGTVRRVSLRKLVQTTSTAHLFPLLSALSVVCIPACLAKFYFPLLFNKNPAFNYICSILPLLLLSLSYSSKKCPFFLSACESFTIIQTQQKISHHQPRLHYVPL